MSLSQRTSFGRLQTGSYQLRGAGSFVRRMIQAGILFLLISPAIADLHLVPCSGDRCAPCIVYRSDYLNPQTGLRAWLQERFRVYDAKKSGPDEQFLKEHRVGMIPSWIVFDDDHNELFRVSGYDFRAPLAVRMNKLKAQLTAGVKQCQRLERPTERLLQPQEDIGELRQLREELRGLQAENQNLMRRQSGDQRYSETQKQIESLKQLIEKLSQKPEAAQIQKPEVSHEEVIPQTPTEKPAPTVEANNSEHQSGGESDTLGIIAKWAKLGLTVAAPEVALPASAALSVAGFLWRRRKNQKVAGNGSQRGTWDEPLPLVSLLREQSGPTVGSDGEVRLLKEAIRKAKSGSPEIGALGGPAVAREIEDYVARRKATETGLI